MTEPDKVAWQLFIQVNTAAGGKATFETWGSDADLFQPNPQWPSTPKPMVLRRPIVPTVGRETLQRSGHLLVAVPPFLTGTDDELARPRYLFLVSDEREIRLVARRSHARAPSRHCQTE
jgi:hypothetical protein